VSSLAIGAADTVVGFDLPQLLLLIPTVLFAGLFLVTWWRENDDHDQEG
jgi:hypothetical protein